jgi:hypothetical protein
MMNTEGFPSVSEKESKKVPYPYIYVKDNASFRELTEEEKQYLEVKYHPADGDRPYIKFSFYSKTPDNRLDGFLKRTKLPKGLKLGEFAPPKP